MMPSGNGARSAAIGILLTTTVAAAPGLAQQFTDPIRYFDRAPTQNELEQIFNRPQVPDSRIQVPSFSEETFTVERTVINQPAAQPNSRDDIPAAGGSGDQRLFGEPKSPPPGNPADSPDRDGRVNSKPAAVAHYNDTDKPAPSADIKMRFEVNSAQLHPAYIDRIDAFGRFMKNKPEMRIVVVGHTDTTGTPDYNLLLSVKRARSVRDYLIEKHGIAPSRVLAEGRGEEQPLKGVPGNDGRNRRVSITRLN